MARFHVRDTFEIPERKLFVLAGSIVEGDIQPGMFIRVPFNSSIQMTVRFHSIEFARRKDGEEPCLCVVVESELAMILRTLNIRDEIVDVTTDGTD
jgi:hypothetical protein